MFLFLKQLEYSLIQALTVFINTDIINTINSNKNNLLNDVEKLKRYLLQLKNREKPYIMANLDFIKNDFINDYKPYNYRFWFFDNRKGLGSCEEMFQAFVSIVDKEPARINQSIDRIIDSIDQLVEDFTPYLKILINMIQVK